MAKTREALMYSAYFAPRGMVRMTEMGRMIAARHLSPFDRLIGIVGEAGSGKSMLVKGMFPGIEMTNDDNGVNVRPLPILSVGEGGFFSPHTYHLDMRFETAFTPIPELADAVMNALGLGKRVVVEHFEMLEPFIPVKAELLIGVGEEIIVTRPTIFGPESQEVADIVFRSIKYRKMAHTAEDLVERMLWKRYRENFHHGDVRHGFILGFDQKPEVDIPEIEEYVHRKIRENVPVSYVDDEHIRFGEKLHHCTGPRMHVRYTGEIENFRMVPEVEYDSLSEQYLMVGLIGDASPLDYHHLNHVKLD